MIRNVTLNGLARFHSHVVITFESNNYFVKNTYGKVDKKRQVLEPYLNRLFTHFVLVDSIAKFPEIFLKHSE